MCVEWIRLRGGVTLPWGPLGHHCLSPTFHNIFRGENLLGEKSFPWVNILENRPQLLCFKHSFVMIFLLPIFNGSSPRVVVVSSGLMNSGQLDLTAHDHWKTGRQVDPSKRSHAPSGYCDSKLMNALFTRELASRVAGKGVGEHVRIHTMKYMSSFAARLVLYIT